MGLRHRNVVTNYGVLSSKSSADKGIYLFVHENLAASLKK